MLTEKFLYEYEKHTYLGGQNLKATLTVAELSDTLNQRLLEASSDENKELVRKTLNLTIDEKNYR
jgi:hypothetical protein